MKTFRLFSIWMTLPIMFSGCATQMLGSPDCIKVAFAYTGDEKPVEQVGVVIFDRYATAVKIDGEYKRNLRTLSAKCGALQGVNMNEQVHLAPGFHRLELAYDEGGGNAFTKGTIQYLVMISAGDIYQIKSVVNSKRTMVSFEGALVPEQKEFVLKKLNEAKSVSRNKD